METIGGESLVRRSVTTLGHFRGDIIVVAGVVRDDLGLHEMPQVKMVVDTYPNKGPLAGIHGGLKASNTFYNIVVACDMPFLDVGLLEYMVGQIEGYNAVVPRLGDSLEPLHAVYAKNCLKPIETMFSEGDFQTNHLFEKINARYVEAVEIDRFDPKHVCFFNINTKSDMDRARELAAN